jgi:two-component system phosphate regulon response regulator OmpR
VTLDLAGRRLLRGDGAEVKLTAMEFDLLEAFARHPNRVLSRDRLLDLAHNRDWEPFDRSIDIRIARIRRKVEPDPSKPQVIKTVRGAGYMFVSEGR